MIPCMRSTLGLICLLFLGMSLLSCDTEKALDKATRDKIFIMGIGTEPKTLDPQRATSVSEGLVIQALFEGLCAADPNDDAKVKSGVARTWTKNEDATVWTFTLRTSARWSDGEPVTTCDFTNAYHRILHPEGGAKYADMLYVIKNAEAYNKDWRGYILCGLDPRFPQPWEEIKNANWKGHKLPDNHAPLTDDEIEIIRLGLNKLNLQQLEELETNRNLKHHFWTDIIFPETQSKIIETLRDHLRKGTPDLWEKAQVGVEATGEYTLRLILRSPTSYLPLLTRHFTWMPIPSHLFFKDGILDIYNTEWTKPGKLVSNGPFMLKEWRYNDSITVEKNLKYRRAADVKLNGMKFLPIINGFTETRMYFDKKIHASNNVPAEMMPFAKEKGKSDFRLDPYYATTFYRFNTNKEPLNDSKVRLALTLALNQKSLVENVAQGAGSPAKAFTPPDSHYRPPEKISYNPEKARALLAEAGFPDGKNFPKLTILTTSREVQKTITEAVQAQWKKELNIQVEIKSAEWASYKLAQQQGDYDIAYSSWSGDFPDPSTFLELWTTHNGNNNTGWNHPEYERLIELARRNPNTEERLELFQKAESILLDHCPIAPLFWSKRAYLLSPDVKGWGALQLDTRPYRYLDLVSPSKQKNQPKSPEQP